MVLLFCNRRKKIGIKASVTLKYNSPMKYPVAGINIKLLGCMKRELNVYRVMLMRTKCPALVIVVIQKSIWLCSETLHF